MEMLWFKRYIKPSTYSSFIISTHILSISYVYVLTTIYLSDSFLWMKMNPQDELSRMLKSSKSIIERCKQVNLLGYNGLDKATP